MIKQRLIDLDLKITELAGYLNISRPTCYKYIECYENNELRSIPLAIRKLFAYIEENPLIDKLNVIDYIINTIHRKQNPNKRRISKTKVVSLLGDYCKFNPTDFKLNFILEILKENKFDFIIDYLIAVDCASVKDNKNSLDERILASFEKVCKLIKKTTEDI